MADMDELKEAERFYTDIPQKTEGFFSQRIKFPRLGNEKQAC